MLISKSSNPPNTGAFGWFCYWRRSNVIEEFGGCCCGCGKEEGEEDSPSKSKILPCGCGCGCGCEF